MRWFRVFSGDGRIGLGTFWLLIGLIVLLNVVAVVALQLLQDAGNRWASSTTALNAVLFWLLLTTMAKRFHDTGRSSFWIVIATIPVVGWIWGLIVLGAVRGERGINRYGDPESGSPFSDHIDTSLESKPAT